MNLQYDNQLAHRVVKAGVPAFRVWQSRRGLAKSNAGLRLPRAFRAIDRWRAAGRPVGIRPTVDQVVSQGKGVINLLLLPEMRSGIIDGIFQCLIVRVPQVLNRLGIETYWANISGSVRHGCYKLLNNSPKITGASQVWWARLGGEPTRRSILRRPDGTGKSLLLMRGLAHQPDTVTTVPALLKDEMVITEVGSRVVRTLSMWLTEGSGTMGGTQVRGDRAWPKNI